VVDYSPEAVAQRLRLMSNLSCERGFVNKGVDMSPDAVADRLRSMNALSRLCARLGSVGPVEAGEKSIEGDALVLRKPPQPARAGWAEAARRVSQKGEDALVMAEFNNDDDADLKW